MASICCVHDISRASGIWRGVIFGDVFSSDVILVDLFGLGSFNRGADGDLAYKIAQKQLPPGMDPSSVGVGEQSLQFSGRPAWGGGVGITGLLSRHIGLNIDQSILGRAPASQEMKNADFGYLRHQTSAGLVLRYPINKLRVAPYGIVGGGAQYGSYPRETIYPRGSGGSTMLSLAGQGFGQLGGGVEWRVARKVGIFSDLRWMYSGVSGLPNNQMQFRYGLRIAF